jgi:predicted O-methyltransferase YrrM
MDEEWQPLPYSMHGWNQDSPVFAELIEKVKPKTIIEVGVWMGASLCNMLDMAKNAKAYAVDTWLGSLEFWTNGAGTFDRNLMLNRGYPRCYDQFYSNIIHRGHVDRVEPIPLPSDIAAEVLCFRGIKADLIYVDASHEYERVKRDFESYLPLLSDCGAIFGDDTSWPGVARFVHEIKAEVRGDKWIFKP